MAPPIHQPLPFPRGQPATLYQQAVQPPGKSSGLGVTFDSSTTKPAATGSQDADVCRRQGTQGRDDNNRPASHSKGVRERSSIRMTSKQTPRQVGERPSGVPRNVPPASTPGSTLPQRGSGARATPKDPLKNVANYKSARWRKDLDHVLKAYYKHNYASSKEAEWTNLKDKFFKHLIQHQDEWRSIKENHPLQYMPYMEKHFHATTGIKLKGLSDFMGWIKRGSYYHAVVARKGQFHKCPHLAGVELPRWLQVTPSKSHQVSQRREETPTTSPIHQAKRLVWLEKPSPMYLLPWRQVEWGMAGPGCTGPRPVLMMNSGETGLQSIASQHRGDGKSGQHFPSRSKITMGGVHQYSGSTNMQESNHGPTTMWPPRE